MKKHEKGNILFLKILRNPKCRKFKNKNLHFLNIELYFKKNYKISKIFGRKMNLKKNNLQNFRI